MLLCGIYHGNFSNDDVCCVPLPVGCDYFGCRLDNLARKGAGYILWQECILDEHKIAENKFCRRRRQAMCEDNIKASFLGLAMGDAFGAPYEGGILEHLLWAIIGKRWGKRRWTDDTQMAIDLSRSLMSCNGLDRDDLATRLASSYHWSRGYGPGTRKVLRRIRKGVPWHVANRAVFENGSFGNGAAVRSLIVGLFFDEKDEKRLIEVASRAAAVTHAHPLGKKGAELTALTTALSLRGVNPHQIIDTLLEKSDSGLYAERLSRAEVWLKKGKDVLPEEVARNLGNNMTAVDSCVTSIYAALTFQNQTFDGLLRFVIDIGGDVDTIAAMACGFWGAMHGMEGIPEERLEEVAEREELVECAESIARAGGS